MRKEFEHHCVEGENVNFQRNKNGEILGSLSTI